jgi:HlyD family secretion protein
MASKKTRILAGVVGVVVLGGVVAVSVTRDSRNRVKVQTETATRKDLTSVVSASGEVQPHTFVDVSANVSGRITALLVREGDSVSKGQVVARIDSTRFEAATRQAEAAVQAARADLLRARADLELSRLAFERQESMHRARLVSDQAFDQAQAEVQMKQAAVDSQRERVAQAEASLASIRDDLEKTTVVSPMDGVVTSLKKEMGEVVIGAQSFQPTVIMTIGDLSVMEAEILIDETDIRDVALGQEAEVSVDALDDLKIAGTVTEIGSSAIPRGSSGSVSTGSTSNQAKDFKVVITLKDPPAALRPGLNATADITTAHKQGVLAVPIQAVVVRMVDQEGHVIESSPAEGEKGGPEEAPMEKGEEKEGVFVVKEGQAHFQPAKTGIVGETDIEITEGLEEGSEIVTGSYKTLRTLENEARIKVDKKKEA